jgi:hypothetical protein
MTTYTINFLNQSGSTGNFCICQQNPTQSSPNSFSLAWLVKPDDPQSNVPISWNTNWFFFWAKTGPLAPGIIFNAGEAFPTNYSNNNAITLTKKDLNYKFIDQRNGNQPGVLSITTDHTIASNQASIGIGMSGSSIVAIQARPNELRQYSPHPENWILFGDFQQGQVLDPSKINNAVKVVFPNGIFSMNATLNQDNTWTVTQGKD